MKKYWHEKTIEFPIYHGNLKIILTDHTEAVNRMFDDDSFHYATTYMRQMDNRRTSAIVLNMGNDPYMTHGTIAHESIHAADFLFEQISAKHDFDNPEPYAYLVGWITNEVYEFIQEKKFQSKIKNNKDRWIKNPKSSNSTDSSKSKDKSCSPKETTTQTKTDSPISN